MIDSSLPFPINRPPPPCPYYFAYPEYYHYFYLYGCNLSCSVRRHPPPPFPPTSATPSNSPFLYFLFLLPTEQQPSFSTYSIHLPSLSSPPSCPTVQPDFLSTHHVTSSFLSPLVPLPRPPRPPSSSAYPLVRLPAHPPGRDVITGCGRQGNGLKGEGEVVI